MLSSHFSTLKLSCCRVTVVTSLEVELGSEHIGVDYPISPSCHRIVDKLVAAADPDPLSGKARKARDYGIPIVSEAGLAEMLGR
jgi:hypothetical protein